MAQMTRHFLKQDLDDLHWVFSMFMLRVVTAVIDVAVAVM
jgi:hypothetical protein